MELEEIKSLPVGTILRPNVRDFHYFGVALKVVDANEWTLTGSRETFKAEDLFRMTTRWKVVCMISDSEHWGTRNDDEWTEADHDRYADELGDVSD